LTLGKFLILNNLIAITMGDPAGIGPEVIVKAFKDHRLKECCRPIVIGDAQLLRATAARFAPGLSIRTLARVEDSVTNDNVLEVIDLHNVPENLPMGRASAEGGKASVQYIRTAVDLAMQHRVTAITTAPINKEGIHLAGHIYPGHTELLAEYTGVLDYALMMAGGKLRVVLGTTHVALKDVRALLTQEKIAGTIRLTNRWLSQHVTETPRIAVTGLNPHCGDGGIFGEEESEIIIPAIELARSEGIGVEGPFSADALFPRAKSGEYDAVITMYHDQGMIPIKMESLGHAVNITLGLPIIRTSVDHGTAYDIAGKGLASPESLIEAVKTAALLSKSMTVLK
jgi:4-hydroxythreonine-4-phosphate dehydrogenase